MKRTVPYLFLLLIVLLFGLAWLATSDSMPQRNSIENRRRDRVGEIAIWELAGPRTCLLSATDPFEFAGVESTPLR